ncbi:general secretion pathway protein K [Marinobacter gudaonensis]|uniref:General secretion pathway protein K n=1 Tax=Marinobacter gudaonensis TaxID=375760 RepID=A0A1I6HZR0_9GAMM|nr:general secretion pathway protein K [Marinobacter gudaonensis]
MLVVLWLSLLLTVVAAGVAYNSQVEGLLTRRAVDRVSLLAAANAGIQMAVYQLRHPNPKFRLWADGRPYSKEFEGVDLIIRIEDESGKLGLNRVSQEQLKKLFVSAGAEEKQADSLADAVLDYRDADDLVRVHGAEQADYEAAGLMSGPRNAQFLVLDELLQVYGMNYQLYQKVAPALSVHSQNPTPDLRLAPREVLMMEPGVTEEFVDMFLQARYGETSISAALPTWPGGKQLGVFRGRGPVFNIEVTAMTPNNLTSRIRAVVDTERKSRFAPFTVLRWDEY